MPDGRRAGTVQGTILGFDFGTRKIGVAIGNTISRSSEPLATFRASSRDERLAAVGKLVEEWEPVMMVVGRPVHADGTEHDLTRAATRFANELRARFGLPVHAVDERYTTQVADDQRSGGQRRRAGPGRDAFAAQVILQTWLDEGGGAGP